MSSDTTYESFKYRQAELIRAAAQHRLVREAERANAEHAAAARQRGGADRPRLRGVRLFRRASAAAAATRHETRPEARPSAC